MGFAELILWHPASFKRRCTTGEPTLITLESREDGLTAFDSRGAKMFVLSRASGTGYEMLDSKGRAVLRTQPSASRESEAVVEDCKGSKLTVLDAQTFSWQGNSYSWKAKAGLSLSESATFRLNTPGNANCCPLATLKLPGKGSAAKLRVEAAACDLPLGLLIFQALMIENQWSSLKGIAPLKRLTFSSKWA